MAVKWRAACCNVFEMRSKASTAEEEGEVRCFVGLNKGTRRCLLLIYVNRRRLLFVLLLEKMGLTHGTIFVRRK